MKLHAINQISLVTNVQILPYISQKNDRLANSQLSSYYFYYWWAAVQADLLPLGKVHQYIA